MEARLAHNQEVGGSNPSPATKLFEIIEGSVQQLIIYTTYKLTVKHPEDLAPLRILRDSQKILSPQDDRKWVLERYTA